MSRWFRKAATEPLAVSMASIKLGDRLLIVGSSDIALIAALATKCGLTGRTCVVEEDDAVSARAAAAVEREGALIESFTAPFTTLPFEPGEFDVVAIRNVLRAAQGERRVQLASEARRVLRPGGRCIVIENERHGGLAGLLRSEPDEPGGQTLESTLATAGFRGVRTLAEREGLAFVEGVKPGN
jgi:ubiquinone/menaquinone biosynthesis C-methylase UbiE